jgi:hypothetical protein
LQPGAFTALDATGSSAAECSASTHHGSSAPPCTSRPTKYGPSGRGWGSSSRPGPGRAVHTARAARDHGAHERYREPVSVIPCANVRQLPIAHRVPTVVTLARPRWRDPHDHCRELGVDDGSPSSHKATRSPGIGSGRKTGVILSSIAVTPLAAGGRSPPRQRTRPASARAVHSCVAHMRSRAVGLVRDNAIVRTLVWSAAGLDDGQEITGRRLPVLRSSRRDRRDLAPLARFQAAREPSVNICRASQRHSLLVMRG